MVLIVVLDELIFLTFAYCLIRVPQHALLKVELTYTGKLNIFEEIVSTIF